MTAMVERQELANGVVVRIYDQSRKIAGDRWLVKISCEAAVAVTAHMGQDCREEDAALRSEALARVGDTLTFQTTRERNFVADEEQAAVLAGLIDSARQHLLPHLANPLFPARLFASRYREERACCLVARQAAAQRPDERDEGDGPADFSALFRR